MKIKVSSLLPSSQGTEVPKTRILSREQLMYTIHNIHLYIILILDVFFKIPI